MEFIAPFDHARAVMRDLRRNVFERGTPAKGLRINPETGELRGVACYVL